jgi:Glyoxalase/Bleomycin resistance protein/Dioxygenase superfamily
MPNVTEFVTATPVLASLDIGRSVAFFCSKLGFTKVHQEQGAYGIVASGSVSIHFWACADKRIAEATGCRVGVRGIEALFAQCMKHGIVHPNAPLSRTPWGNHEFAILDPDGNLVTFHEPVRV